MSTYKPSQEALIYEGDENSPYRQGALQVAFAAVADSSQHYRVVTTGFACSDGMESDTPQNIADSMALLIRSENLQDVEDIHAVANACHNILREGYNERLRRKGKTGSFNEVPVIITLRKPGEGRLSDIEVCVLENS